MKDLKFTPGPWHAVEYAGYWEIQSGPKYGDPSILDFVKCEIAEQNAQIIAMAPDLYELCKQQHEALKISRLEMRTAYSIIGGHSHNLDTIEQAIEAFNKLFK